MALLYLKETSDEQFAPEKSHQGQFSRSLLTTEEVGDCISSYTCLPLIFHQRWTVLCKLIYRKYFNFYLSVSLHLSINHYRETYSRKDQSKGFQTIVQEHRRPYSSMKTRVEAITLC